MLLELADALGHEREDVGDGADVLGDGVGGEDGGGGVGVFGSEAVHAGEGLFAHVGGCDLDAWVHEEDGVAEAVVVAEDGGEELDGGGEGGHAVGGVCPFGVNPGVTVYLDESLRRYDVVYPAAGNDHSGVRLSVDELYRASGAQDFVDVTK